MIRIRTTFSKNHRVYTLYHDGKWVTLISRGEAKDANSLLEAGQNHLQAAKAMKDMLEEIAK